MSKLLLLVSLICFFIAGYHLYLRYSPIPTPPGDFQTVSIPELDINLPVLTKPLTPDGVTFAAKNGGNIVLYGHNWPRLLGSLKHARIGQAIYLGSQKFLISDIKTVPADAVGITSDFGDTRLTLYTCTGFLDKDRLVVVAKPG